MSNEITDPSNEIFENEVTFTSSITDTSTGLQYMNARYYEPTTGRFISQDTYTGNAYDPWTQHLYSYCGNNPTNFIDPTGHSAEAIQTLVDEKEYRNGLISYYQHLIISGETGNYTGRYLYGKIESNRARISAINSEISELERKMAEEAAIEAIRQVQNDVYQIIFESIEGDLGVGLGLGGAVEVDISGVSVDIEIVMKVDVLALRLDDGKLDFGAHSKMAINASVCGLTLCLANEEKFMSYLDSGIIGGEWEKIENESGLGMNTSLEVGAQAYVLAGATAEIGVNLDELWFDMKRYIQHEMELKFKPYSDEINALNN